MAYWVRARLAAVGCLGKRPKTPLVGQPRHRPGSGITMGDETQAPTRVEAKMVTQTHRPIILDKAKTVGLEVVLDEGGVLILGDEIFALEFREMYPSFTYPYILRPGATERQRRSATALLTDGMRAEPVAFEGAAIARPFCAWLMPGPQPGGSTRLNRPAAPAPRFPRRGPGRRGPARCRRAAGGSPGSRPAIGWCPGCR